MALPYGQSVGQLAQNEMVLGAQQRAAMERQAEMLIRQIQQKKENERMARLEARQMQLDAENRQQLAFTNKLNQDRMRTQKDQFNKTFFANQRYNNWAMRQPQGNPTREILPLAIDEADEGMFGSIEDVIAKYPSLTGEQASFVTRRSIGTRQAMESELGALGQEAEAINAPARYRNMINAEREVAPMGFMSKVWSPTAEGEKNWRAAYRNPNIEEWERAEIAARPGAESVRANKSVMGQLTVNPETGMYEPRARVLPWMRNQRGGGALRPEMQQKIREAYQAMKAGADPEKVRQHMIKNYGVDINQYRE